MSFSFSSLLILHSTALLLVPSLGYKPTEAENEDCLAKCLELGCTHFGFDLEGKCRIFNDVLVSVKEYLIKNRQPAAVIDVVSVDEDSEIHGFIGMTEREIIPKKGLLTGKLSSDLKRLENFDLFTPDARGTKEFKKMIEGLEKGTIIVAANSNDIQPYVKKELSYFKSIGLDFGKVNKKSKIAFILQKGFPLKTILLTKDPGKEPLELKFKIYRPFDKPEAEKFVIVEEVKS